MRCYICDRALAEPHYNSQHEGYDPCDTCLAVINDAVGLKDHPSADEEDLAEDPAYEGTYPTAYTPFEDENP